MVLIDRDVPAGMPALEAAVRALVAGPTGEESDSGVISAIPAGVAVVGFQVGGDTVEIDLSDGILVGLDEYALERMFHQFKATVGDFPEILAIRLTCRGELLSSYLPKVEPLGAPPAMDPKSVKGGVGTTGTMGLSGINITIGPSHGRFWNGSGWYWQRSDPCGYGEAVLEDTNSIRLMQFLYQYLAQDGATVHVPRDLTESDCCQGDTGLAWWKMAAYAWLRNAGLPCSVYASSSGLCSTYTGSVSRSSDDIRARPLFADYRGSNIYISHHTNAGGGTGTETYRDTAMENPAHETNSYNLALNIHNNVIDAIRNMVDSGWANRGVKDSAGGFGEIRIPNRPACLIELGFHDKCDRDASYLTGNWFRSVSEWGLYAGVCAYFGRTVTWDKYSCEFVSDTIPAQVNAGQQFSVTIKFRNRGVVWSNDYAFKLGAVGDSDPFAGTRQTISGEVRPGSEYSFTFTMTAPSTAGTYTTDWRMLRENVTWFGPTLTKQVVVVVPVTAPTITSHPANQTVCAQATATFSVTASANGGTLSYRWQRNDTDLSNGGYYSGATSSILTVSGVDATVTGNFRCKVTNEAGTVYSNNASLSLKTATTISSHPSGQAMCQGQSATFTVTATGAGTISYRWQFGGSNIVDGDHFSGSGTATLTVSNIDATVAGTYRCQITADCGTATSNEASLSLKANTTLTQHPVGQQVCAGQTATFTVAATGEAPLSYQWQKDGQNMADGARISGVNTSMLHITAVEAGDVGQYRCIVTADCGNATSEAVALALHPATVLTQQPVPQEVCVGGTAEFGVSGSGYGSITYHWQKNGIDLIDGGKVSGVTTATLRISGVDQQDVADYRCVVTADCGNAVSENASLVLKPDVGIGNQPQSLVVCPGVEAVFTATASGSGPFSYEWRKDGAVIVGAPNAASYTISAVTADDTGHYSVQVSGICGPPVISQEASLTVEEEVRITSQPSGLMVCPGAPAVFRVEAAGKGPFHYEWQRNGSPIPGAPDEAAYVITSAGSGQVGQYRVRVTGGCGAAVVSSEAQLTLNHNPVIRNYETLSMMVDVDTNCPSEGQKVVLEADDQENDALSWRIKPGSEPVLGTVLFVNGDRGPSLTMCYDPIGYEGYDYFVVEVADDCGGIDEVTVDVLIVHAPRITSWQSILSHGPSGELAITLAPDRTDGDIGVAGPISEPRVGGVRLSRVFFTEEMAAADGQLDVGDVTVSGWDGSNIIFYSPSSVAMANADRMLEIRFDPAAGGTTSPLPDGARYTIELGGYFVGKWTGVALAGDTNCQVRALVGDVSNDGRINLIDLGLAKIHLGSPAGPTTVRADINRDGVVSLVDMVVAKTQYGYQTP